MLTYILWDVGIDIIQNAGKDDAIDYFLAILMILLIATLTLIFMAIDLFLIPIEIIAYLLAKKGSKNE